MGLNENCKTYLNEFVAFKPEYGWGWTRLDAPESRVPAQVNGVPFPFHCRIRDFFDFRGELRGFVGRVEQAEHIYNGLLVVVSTRVVGTFNLPTTCRIATYSLARANLQVSFVHLFLVRPSSTALELSARRYNTLPNAT